MILPESDTTVRNTFIRSDEDADGEDTTLPAFSNSGSGPAAHGSKRRNWSDIFEEEEESDMEFEAVGSDILEKEPKRLGSSWAIHSRGACVPCAYFILKRDGCWKGSQCNRCHFCTDVELRQWKKTTRKAKNEWRKLERKAREGAVQATGEQVARKEAATLVGKIDSADDSWENMSRCESLRRPFIVKNTFLHFSSDDEDEGSLPVRKCESDPCLMQGGSASKLDAFRARLSDLLANSARLDGQKRSSGSHNSSCSTSLSPSTRGHFGCQATWSSGSTDAGEPVDEADDSSDYIQSIASHATREAQATGLETQGANLETHQSGNCKPCFYFSFKADGCRKGADCIYCHFCSGEESRQRKRSAKTVAKQIKRTHGLRCCSKSREG